MTATPPPFAALLLAGGRSRRMGSDKALLDWHGRPLWQVQLDKLVSLRPAQTLIACRREQKIEINALLGASVSFLFDPPDEDLGPMPAIARALHQAALPLLTLAVDLPLLTAGFLNRLLQAQVRNPRKALFCRSEQGIEPLAGVYLPTMLPLMQESIERRALSLHKLIEAAAAGGLARIDPLPHDVAWQFANANDPEEWVRLQKQS